MGTSPISLLKIHMQLLTVAEIIAIYFKCYYFVGTPTTINTATTHHSISYTEYPPHPAYIGLLDIYTIAGMMHI